MLACSASSNESSVLVAPIKTKEGQSIETVASNEVPVPSSRRTEKDLASRYSPYQQESCEEVQQPKAKTQLEGVFDPAQLGILPIWSARSLEIEREMLREIEELDAKALEEAALEEANKKNSKNEAAHTAGLSKKRTAEGESKAPGKKRKRSRDATMKKDKKKRKSTQEKQQEAVHAELVEASA
jgi:hypothetical protein